MKQKTRNILILILVATIALGSIIVLFNNRGKGNVKKSYTEYSGFVSENSYADYLSKYADAELTEETVEVPASGYSSYDGEIELFENYADKQNTVLTDESGYIEWTVNVPKAGFYNIKADYLTYGGNDLTVERTVYIDGEIPFDEAKYLTFERLYKDVTSTPAKDLDGNDIRPGQEQLQVWQEKFLSDASGYYKEPLKFYLTQGHHTVRFAGEREPLMLLQITLCADESVPTYEEYIKMYDSKDNVSGEAKIIQAEEMYQKSEKSNYPINDRTSSFTQPQAAYSILLNTVGGTRWQKVGSSISWIIEVDESGYYKIAPRYKQDYISGVKVYRKLTINGRVPFKGADNLVFDYDTKWQCEPLGNEKEDYLFYFEKGKEYVVEMEVTLGDMDNILRRTQATLNELNDIYKEILMITGASPDKYRDYSFDKLIPDTLENLTVQANELKEIKEEFESVNEASGERVAQLTKMEYLIRRMAEDSSEIAGKFSTFQDNLSALGTWITSMSNQPLSFDYIAVIPESGETPRAEGNFLQNLGFQFKLFSASFVVDYSNIGRIEDTSKADSSIKVWVSSGRDQMNTIRSLINSDFTKNTGIAVDLELVTAGTLLRSVAAGKAPDVSLGNAINDPINLALRNAVYDLKSFDDYDEVVKRFFESAMVPYTYRNKVYALPETMHFNVMFYRKDILEELGLEAPTTWNEWDSVISELSKKNMQVGLPHDQNMLLTFMYQLGSELYNDDGKSVNLDSKEAYYSFEKLTEYYTLYDFETEYDFVNRFRSGEMPLAIADFTLYNQLALFAPEIQGDWGMALVPGTVTEDGTVNKVYSFVGTSTIMLNGTKNPEACWEFMKWWSSTEIQASYCNEMETVINASAKQPTANLEALKKLPWASDDLKTLITAYGCLKGTPQVPGGYYVDRTYGFAFNRVINDSEDPSETLQRYIESINSELTRKRREFGITE